MAAVETYNQVDISQLECHFKWFNELNNAFNGQWLTEILNKHLHKDLQKKLNGTGTHDNHDAADDHVEDSEERHDETNETFILTSSRLASLSWRCTLILRNVFEKNFTEAFQMSKELLSLKEAINPSQPQVHIDTFAYVVLANQLNILKEWRSFTDFSSVNDDEAVVITKKIESLRSSVDSNEGKAFITAMKSNLARDFLNSQLRVDFAQKATEMNPLWAGWQQQLYFALRQQRRSTDFRQVPSQLEIETCKKSYELEKNECAGNVSICNANLMSKLYGELLSTCSRGGREHEEITERAIAFARETVRLKPRSQNMKIRLASLLSSNQIYRRYRNQGYDEALRLYRECEVGSCSSEVCHKLGKFYDSRKNPAFNSFRALEWFEKGLEAHIGNFPCFADMLKNSVFRRKSTTEIIEKIDFILSFQSKQNYKCQTMFIKGFFLWTNDPDAALQWWLMTMEEPASAKINFTSLATFNFCYIKDGNRSQALRMMNIVKLFMMRQEVANSGDQRFIQFLDIVNSVIEYFARDRNVVNFF